MREYVRREPDKYLKAGQEALASGTHIYDDKLNWDLHELAEMHYEPAIPFFIECLDAEDDEWRLEAVRYLGFHYALGHQSKAVKKMRALVIRDSDEDVRMAAASVLGIQSKWPEPALVQALKTDKSEFVRSSAFESLLQLAGLSYNMQRAVLKEKYPTSVEGLKKALQDYNANVIWGEEDASSE